VCVVGQTWRLLGGLPTLCRIGTSHKYLLKCFHTSPVFLMGADHVITSAIDTHVQGEKRGDGDCEDGAAGVLVPTA